MCLFHMFVIAVFFLFLRDLRLPKEEIFFLRKGFISVLCVSSLLSVKKGSSPEFPGVSCKDIWKFTNAQKNGEYWIDPKGTEIPFKVYCDMTADGGKFCPFRMRF